MPKFKKRKLTHPPQQEFTWDEQKQVFILTPSMFIIQALCMKLNAEAGELGFGSPFYVKTDERTMRIEISKGNYEEWEKRKKGPCASSAKTSPSDTVQAEPKPRPTRATPFSQFCEKLEPEQAYISRIHSPELTFPPGSCAPHSSSTKNNFPIQKKCINTIPLQEWKQLPKETRPVPSFKISLDALSAAFYSRQGALTKDCNVTFVFINPEKNSLIPKSDSSQRIVIVLSSEEYDQQPNHPETLDVLVVQKLAFYPQKAYCPSVTRKKIAAMLLAYHVGLKDCVFMNSDISKISTATDLDINSDWSTFYRYLQANLGQRACLSMQTYPNKNPSMSSKNLGQGLFLFNIEQLKTQLPNLADVCFLFPPPPSTAPHVGTSIFKFSLQKSMEKNPFKL